MNTTHDVDTSLAGLAQPALIITDLKHLSDVVYEIASTELAIDKAACDQKAKVEAAKKAFEDATAELQTERAIKLAAIEVFCEANKDTLFPIKGDTRKKTYKVLQHELKYRSSTEVITPDDAVTKALDLIEKLDSAASNAANPTEADSYEETITRLRAFLRQPPTEINKEAVGATDDQMKAYLKQHLGISENTKETFKVVFKFTPEQKAA